MYVTYLLRISYKICMNIQNNFSMSKVCTFRCGGKALWFCEVENFDEFKNLLKLHENKKLFILGNGSNTLCSDSGFNGLVICTKKLKNIEIKENIVICDCGVNLFDLNQKLARNGLSGLEWSYGIPGTVGGACAMNAGSFGFELGDYVEKIEVFENKQIKLLDKKDIIFSYRKSNIKLPIIKVWLKLTKNSQEKVEEKMQNFFSIKTKNQPTCFGSAGSVFKRQGEIIPAKIIEELGLKGYKIGGAEISEKHCGFIVNKGKASATEIIKMIDFIKNRVKIERGINLEEEIIILE